ncbi:MAG: LemA family protein, partial [Myxococcales bacterium]
IVATVKGEAAFEQDTLTQVVEARAKATSIQVTPETLNDPAAFNRFQQAQGELSSALSRLMVSVERYPDLKANKGFSDLRVQLEGTENRILRAREEYNGAARDYNTELGQVGGAAVNKVTGQPFKPRVYFKASAESQVAPTIKFDSPAAPAGSR